MAARLGVEVVPLAQGLMMVHVDHDASAYWQALRGTTGHLDTPDGCAIFSSERVLVELAAELSGVSPPRFAIVKTDHAGGAGDQWACVFEGERRVTRLDASINDALAALGVVRVDDRDELESTGLHHHREAPASLERFVDLCDALGV